MFCVGVGERHAASIVSAEHSIDIGHHILLNKSRALDLKFRYRDCLIQKAIEMELHPNKFGSQWMDFHKI
jgi:hypothetical protein